MMDSDLVVRYSMIEPGYKEVFILTGVVIAATFLTVMKILFEKLFHRGSLY